MSRLVALVSLAIAIFGSSAISWAQLPSDLLSRETELLNFLETAEIVHTEQLPESVGVTEPFQLTLKGEGGQLHHALYKDVHGQVHGYWEGWKYEIAAFQLDRYLGLNMVPPTTTRRVEGQLGSCQLWIEEMTNGREMQDKGLTIPGEFVERWTRSLALQEAFDNLIGNEDRIMRNILVSPRFELILIDHSRAFRRTPRSRKKLTFAMPSAMKVLPRAFVEKIRGLDRERLQKVVGDLLSRREVDAVLARRGLVLRRIDEMIRERGEEAVLY